MSLKYTPVDEIKAKTLPLPFRRAQLLQIARLFQENNERLTAALTADLGRHKLEISLPEMGLHHLWRCSCCRVEKPTVEEWRSSWDTSVYTVPKGVVLIIGPWNYPYVTTMLPLVGAMAAGCPCIVKPSEFNPHCAQLLAELFPKYLDQSAYRIVNGAAAETTALLDLKWDHIFLLLAVAALAESSLLQLSSTLRLSRSRLGSKSPVYIDPSNTDIDLAAKRILWGKQQNSGTGMPICVAPDYILVPRAHQDARGGGLQKGLRDFLAPSQGRSGREIRIRRHPEPLTTTPGLMDLLGRTKGDIVLGGKAEGTKRIEPTIVANVKLGDALMEEELFGPIIPIVPVDGLTEAIQIIRDGINLLSRIITYSDDRRVSVLESTQSGTLVLNDTFMQLGGEESGYGSYLGKHSFNTFVHRRSYINVPRSFEPFNAYRYPPYSEEAFQVLSGPANVQIPPQ
ncbi:aldehyde dehydrogenase [Favolaschia claudopus]|uniref:Aldehyde dehydrogenase n=1 Tax=Favolaschia claudopus TaxID=2862362 RepID=A0AAW0AMK5_9AGAR